MEEKTTRGRLVSGENRLYPDVSVVGDVMHVERGWSSGFHTDSFAYRYNVPFVLNMCARTSN